MNKKRGLLFTFCLIIFCQTSWAQLEPTRSTTFSSDGQNRPLRLEDAFPFYLSVTSPGEFNVIWNLAPGHYLYRHAFQFLLVQGEDKREQSIAFTLPEGVKKTDQFFGDIEAFYGDVSVNLSLPTVPRPEALIVIEYQGCADWGFCYPPQRKSLALIP